MSIQIPSLPISALRGLSLAVLAAVASARDLTVERLAAGLELPIYAGAPLGDERIFILEQHTGKVLILDRGGILDEPFLDVGRDVNDWFEGGLLSMAFHPEFDRSGRFFISLTDILGDLVVREYQVGDHRNVADPIPIQELLRLHQPNPVHNGGHLELGPDGMLYVALGDGGPGGDPSGRGQDLGNLYGTIVRLDVDLPPPFVPADNPFVGVAGVEEAIWVWGLCNPWLFQFDALTGDLWIADVGQIQREEVDFLPAGSPGGANFGWRCREGLFCFDATCCSNPGFTDPLFEYAHTAGRCAIIGAGAYRGSRMPALQGAYLCGDYCSRELYVLRQEGGVLTSSQLLPPPTYAGFPAAQKLRAFGFDGQGEILMVDGGTGPGTGEVFRLIPAEGVERYCSAGIHSGGTSAQLDHQGSPSLASASFGLSIQNAIPSGSGLFFYGPQSQDVPFRDGRLCVHGADVGIFRISPAVTLDATGAVAIPIDFQSSPFASGPGAIRAGSTWFFQFLYRDPDSRGSGQNLSDALAVTFAP